MRNTALNRCLAALLLTAYAPVAPAAETSSTINVKARIDHVTPFDDAAVISCSGRVILEEGDTLVTFTDLPNGFSLENARITGYGKARVTLQDAVLEDGPGRSSRRLRLHCEVSRAGEFGFSVAYRDGPVFCRPDYLVRIDTAEKKLSIEYAVVLTQTTRDPWRNVSLTILPHRMGRGGVLPRQDPWQLALAGESDRGTELEGMQDQWSGLPGDEQFYEMGIPRAGRDESSPRGICEGLSPQLDAGRLVLGHALRAAGFRPVKREVTTRGLCHQYV